MISSNTIFLLAMTYTTLLILFVVVFIKYYIRYRKTMEYLANNRVKKWEEC